MSDGEENEIIRSILGSQTAEELENQLSSAVKKK